MRTEQAVGRLIIQYLKLFLSYNHVYGKNVTNF
jgi:hypothetical protein